MVVEEMEPRSRGEPRDYIALGAGMGGAGRWQMYSKKASSAKPIGWVGHCGDDRRRRPAGQGTATGGSQEGEAGQRKAAKRKKKSTGLATKMGSMTPNHWSQACILVMHLDLDGLIFSLTLPITS